MSNEVSVTRPDRRIRVVLLALSILCALIPAVVLILTVDADHKRAALAHDAATTVEAASQISLAVRSVERQLDAGAALAGANPRRDSMIRSFLRAVQSSNHDLISVGFVARYGTRPSRAAFPVYHAAGDRPYITVTVPINGEGTGLTAVLDGKTVTGRLHFLADAPGAGAYLFTTGGRLLAASGVGSPRASYAPVSGERPSQRIVEDGGGLEGLGLLRASTWYVTEKPIHGTNWVLLLERRQHGLLFSRFPLLFGAASVLFAALMALIAALLLRRCARGPAKRGLEDAVRRSEILLRETHHRVKNDLQILSSILHLSDRPGLAGGDQQGRAAPPPRPRTSRGPTPFGLLRLRRRHCAQRKQTQQHHTQSTSQTILHNSCLLEKIEHLTRTIMNHAGGKKRENAKTYGRSAHLHRCV